MTKSSKKRWPLFQFLVNKIENFIVPTKRLIILLLGGMIFISIGAFFEGGLYLLVVFNGLILLLSCIDLYMLPKQKQLRINRHFPEKVDVGEEIEAAIEIINESGQPLSFSVTDDFPIEFEHPGIVEGSLTKPSTYVQYQVRAKERGQFQLNYLYFRYWGGLGLWMKQSKIEQTHEVKVYPDLSSVRGYLASTQEELILEGKKVNRRIRTGSEFNSIREYVPDDDPRFINWTASARQHKLMTNVFSLKKGKVSPFF
ncbi:DUF58 domain-containing protein [Caldalkalibacillus mannanilyticus]|uniref:DUF58 domain-containing protein n=1 Tax=Caldalkalibacillus mannanilyticus TaxID=1418 RepID=UPI000A4EE381